MDPGEPLYVEIGFVQIKQAVDEERVVVDEGGDRGMTVAIATR